MKAEESFEQASLNEPGSGKNLNQFVQQGLPRRSVLFISALQNEMYDVAASSGTDVLCLDLEDGVPLDKKEEARNVLLDWLERGLGREQTQIAVRVNSPRTREGMLDLLALAAVPTDVQIVLPKAETEAEVTWVIDIFNEAGKEVGLHCVIETCSALQRVDLIARSSPNLYSLMFGGFDLSTALGVEMSWEPLLYARSRVVHAAATMGLDVLDAPHLQLMDTQGLAVTTRAAQKLGFTGRITKHIDQVATINDVFTPPVEYLEKAAAIIAKFEESPYSQIVVDGKVIEQPAIRAMKRALSLRNRSSI